jgi:hypothetical protein
MDGEWAGGPHNFGCPTHSRPLRMSGCFITIPLSARSHPNQNPDRSADDMTDGLHSTLFR